MMLSEANASRTNGLISVILIGYFSSPSEEVIELGHYPGTGMGCARVFLGERRKPGHENVRGSKFWTMHIVIPDHYSRIVEIFINDQLVRKVRVIEFSGQGSYRNH